MSDEREVVTGEDVRALNAITLQRAGFFARVGGNVLVVVGAVGVIAWAWLMVRQQLRGDGYFAFSSDSGDESASLTERVDVVVSTFGFLVQAALAVAVGLAIRLLASNVLAQTGASLTGFEPGDAFPLDPEPEATDLTP